MLRSLLLIVWLPYWSTAFATPWWGVASHRGKTSSFLASTTTTTDTVISEENLALLSDRGRQAILRLAEHDDGGGAQAHVVGGWPQAGEEDEGKQRLAEQANLDASYPGGLPAYLGKAKMLLEESAAGTNPFADFEAAVPDGETLTYAEDGYAALEEAGLDASAGLVFCLVAGGLGERLGYSGIKLSLGTNLCTDACYLELYCQFLLAVQQQARERSGNNALELPLVIMTSGDTDAATRELLKTEHNFGLSSSQLFIVMQDKVAALKDGTAGIALDSKDRWTVQTKPHGHGDVHHLLFREGLVDRWGKEGRTHIVFLQDTNALVINSVLPALGVSVRNDFHMNSICIPRIAGEAAGAITRLEHKSDPNKSLVINVEYNQLDPLLKTQGEGDVPDPETGYSPFPGNANNLVIELSAYAKTLRGEDQGVVLEFVNPKYKDATRTDFKKPTRLECMMQDIPKLFQKELGQEAKIGFTTFDRWCTFSPAKNALEAGQESVNDGNMAPGTLSSAESDMYVQNQKKLKDAGVNLRVVPEEEFVAVAGIPVTPGPRVILSPSFCTTKKELESKVCGNVKISERSTLVIEGRNVELKQLDLDGALVIRVESEDASLVVDGLAVKNEGWSLEELDADGDYDEATRIRGYTLNRRETKEIIISEPGEYVLDESGSVKKL